MRRNETTALTLAAVLVTLSGLVSPRLPERWAAVVHGVFSAALAVAADAPLGLRPPALRSGLRTGGVAAALVSTGVAAASAVPGVRTAMTTRDLPAAPSRWLMLRIPLGTVWAEEVAYRGVLGHLGAAAFGPTRGRLLQSVAFGLSHIADARAAGEPLAGTVLTTGVAGWVFAWLGERSGSLAAPMLAHLALNESGALAALAAQRRLRRVGAVKE
ncbi:abortive phage infection protein [Mycobacterium sp. IS-1496]|uniref:Rv0804 family intramembrane glutamic endopeptidase n=1 Tax=Mycobacterium sp. IS-1496 TaxID=1772284 RepID=UPI000741595C|nr:CPBP family intramembrane glutamic endopeptidase [Mycobacterium sp. IS-1496]KUI37643.1 abortive phage infection protein [Mycobacterium sp. IS-1496]